MASTKPSPKTLRESRNVRMVSVSGTRSWISLSAKAASGLGVVERPDAVGELLDLVEFCLVGLMGGIVHYAVGLVVKARGGVCGLGGDRNDSKTQNSRCDEELQECLLERIEGGA